MGWGHVGSTRAGGRGSGSFCSSIGGPSTGVGPSFASSPILAGGLQLHCFQLRLGQECVAAGEAALVLGAGQWQLPQQCWWAQHKGGPELCIQPHFGMWVAAALLTAQAGAGVGWRPGRQLWCWGRGQ